MPHPTTYKVSWLQKCHQVFMNGQCQVEFHIDEYKEQVLCDIIQKDACHVLLGRPLKYDRKLNYYGNKNTYGLEKDNTKHVLFTIKDEGTKKNFEPRILLMSGKRMVTKDTDNVN